MTKIMSGICDKETRMKLLAISPLPDLQKVTNLCRSEESAKLDEARMGRAKSEKNVYRARSKSKDISKSSSCRRCRRSTCLPKGQTVCPATGKTCLNCHKKGHFASVCFSRPNVQCATDNKRKADGHVRVCARSIHETQGDQPAPQITVALHIAKTKDHIGSLEATPDTGAEATLAGTYVLDLLGIPAENLLPLPHDNLIAANGHELCCIGTLPCVIEYCGRSVDERVYICERVDTFLLAWYTCMSLDILPNTYPRPIN